MANQRWISVGISLGISLLLVTLIIPAIQEAREAARRSTSKNNLKQIGISLHSYHETHGCFPPGGIIRDDGKAMHGWITMLLPFFDASPDYYMLDKSEPWQSPANRIVFERARSALMIPDREQQYSTSGYGVTHYLANPHLLHRNSSVRYKQMERGRAHTWVAGEVVGNYQPWSYPFNWRPLGTKMCSGPDSYGQFIWYGGHLLHADGSVSLVDEGTSPAILKHIASAPPVPTSEQMAVPEKRFKSVAFGLQWEWVALQSDPESRTSYDARVLKNQKQQPLMVHLFFFIEPTEQEAEELRARKSFTRHDFLVSIDSDTDIPQALKSTSLSKDTTPEQFQANVKTLRAIQKQLPKKDSTR